MSGRNRIHRRRFLSGLGGVTIGLPVLDAFLPRRAQAQADRPVYSVFILGHNGIVQNVYGSGNEMYWPRTPGRLTKASMMADKDRATSELADYAERALLVRGTRYTYGATRDTHSGSSNQTFTGAPPSKNVLSGGRTKSGGESIDNRIAKAKNPEGREPLVLYVGSKPSYESVTDNLSYSGPEQVRVGENNPWLAYQRLVGMGQPAAGGGNAEAAKVIGERRKSANDFVRAELSAMMKRRELSAEDRSRLDQHFTSIRELEVRLQTGLPPDREMAMQAVNGTHTKPENLDTVIGLMTDIIALAIASGHTRTAGLQFGFPTDLNRYTVEGKIQENFHYISHRVMSHGGSGTPIANAERLHHGIDRLQLRALKGLLDKLEQHRNAEGSLVDQGFYVYGNALGDGPRHIFRGIPYVSVGGARGRLKTGQFVDYNALKKEPHASQVLVSYLMAAGVTAAGGGPVDDFGGKDAPKSPLGEMLA